MLARDRGPKGEALPSAEGRGRAPTRACAPSGGGPIGRGRPAQGLRTAQDAPGVQPDGCSTGIVWPVGGSGGGETGHLLLGLGRLLGAVGLGEDQRHRLDRQVAALDQPFVVLL